MAQALLAIPSNKFSDAVASLGEDSRRSTEYNAEEVVGVEALSRKHRYHFLVQELLAKVQIVRDVVQLIDIDSYHHIHGSLRSDYSETDYLAKRIGDKRCMGLESVVEVVVKGLGGVEQERRNGRLDNGVRTENNGRHLLEAKTNLVESTKLVIDADPAHAPAGGEILLGEATNRQDRNAVGECRESKALDTLEHNSKVNLVGDDGETSLFAEGDDVKKMLLGKDGTTRVGRVVYDDALGLLIDERLGVDEVNFPVLLGVTLVVTDLDSRVGSNGLIERKSGVGQQDVVSGASQSRNSNSEGTRAPRREDNILDAQSVFVVGELLGDGGTGGRRTSRVVVS